MPTYDYVCDHCGHAFSARQSFTDEAVAACPRCGKRPRRTFAAPAIVFKGSGWYKTDSRVGKASPEGGTDKASASDKGGGGSSDRREGATDGGGDAASKSAEGGKGGTSDASRASGAASGGGGAADR